MKKVTTFKEEYNVAAVALNSCTSRQDLLLKVRNQCEYYILIFEGRTTGNCDRDIPHRPDLP
jgi:hypothetical protein